MAQLSRNIIDNTSPTLLVGRAPYGTRINSMSLCNSGATTVTLTLTKVWGSNVDQTYLLLDNVPLNAGKTLYYNNLVLPGGWNLNLNITGGTLDMDMDFAHMTTNPT